MSNAELPKAFKELMEQSRIAEVLDAATARHKLNAERGDKMPLEMRAAFAASFYLALTVDASPQTRNLCIDVFKVLDPELFVEHPEIFLRISKTLMKDFNDFSPAFRKIFRGDV